ncbi:/ fruA / EIIABC-Fru /:139640 Forward [Candidatus Hepatoplasma crinochetorum]|uniref:/ fruA / EIIABC-Fru /:139640 Forward n=1 Tax=Candidatus Hepatoplasma crinochetorum TaxID=295596 RepID=A0A0G7ZNG7_9MOLU|nr:/ fruA / EIIABC-Fru /:139640 Forward [Candidatus Hepatoplasma crinochetorum]
MSENKIAFEKLIVDKDFNSSEEVLHEIANLLKANNFIEDSSTAYSNLLAREKQISTGVGNGIAIPHAEIKDLEEPKIAVIRSKKGIEWNSIDSKKVNLIISILVPKENREKHFEILTKLSSSLVEAKNIEKFKNANAKELVDYIENSILNEKEQEPQKLDEDKNVKKQNGDRKEIFIVGITTCPTGVAHTFMAAKALEEEAPKHNIKLRIEKQGQMTRDKLSQKEIDQADYVLLAIGKGIDEPERFIGKKIYQVPIGKALVEPGQILEDTIIKAKAKGGGEDKNQQTEVRSVNSEKKSFNEGPIRHLLSGISYMIPFIAFAGILLGLTTAFGYSTGYTNADGIIDPTNPLGQITESFAPKGYAALAISNLAGMGFTLFVPILGGFIGSSIAGRKALAPSMMLSLVLNDASGTSVFNYQEGRFGGFDPNSDPVALGFFGAIAAGYLVGYLILYFTKYTDKVENQAFQTILPLIIIPLVFTFVPWVFFAFIGYLPLYWLSVGLNDLINVLIDVNLLWLVGAILGTMICFDLGGPVNKMAMVTAALFLAPGANYLPLLNGAAAVCVAIPPMVLVLCAYMGPLLGFRMDEADKVNATSAGVMGFFGVTEGSIPFAAKDPKVYIPSFMTAGFFAGMIAILVGVGNSVSLFGGPIIYLAGGMGKSPDIGGQVMSTDYLYALLYFVPLIIGAFIGMFMVCLLNKIYSSKKNKLSYELKNELKKDKQKQLKIAKFDIKELNRKFKKAKIDQKEYQKELAILSKKIADIEDTYHKNLAKLFTYDNDFKKYVADNIEAAKKDFLAQKDELKKEILDYKAKIKEIKNSKEKIDKKEQTKEYEDLKTKFKELKKEVRTRKNKISDLHFQFLNHQFADSKKIEYHDKLKQYLTV